MDNNAADRSSSTDRASIHTSGTKTNHKAYSTDVHVNKVFRSGSYFRTYAREKLGITKDQLLQIWKSPLWKELSNEWVSKNLSIEIDSNYENVYVFVSSFSYVELDFIKSIFKSYAHKVDSFASFSDIESMKYVHTSSLSHRQPTRSLSHTTTTRSDSIDYESVNNKNDDTKSIKDDSTKTFSRSLSVPTTWTSIQSSSSLPYSDTHTTIEPGKRYVERGVTEQATERMKNTNSLSHHACTDTAGTKLFEEHINPEKLTSERTDVKSEMHGCHSEKNTAESRQITEKEKSIESDVDSENLSTKDRRRAEAEESADASENKSTNSLISSHISLNEEHRESDDRTYEINVNGDDYSLLLHSTDVQTIIKQSLDCTRISLIDNNMIRLQFSSPGKTLEKVTDEFESIFSKIKVKRLSYRPKLEDILKELHMEEKIMIKEDQKIVTIVGVKESILKLLVTYTEKHDDSIFSYDSVQDVSGLYEMLIKESRGKNVFLCRLDDSKIYVAGTSDDVQKLMSTYKKITESDKISMSDDVNFDNKPHAKFYIDPRYVTLFKEKPDALDMVKKSLPRDYQRVTFSDDGGIILPENNTSKTQLKFKNAISDLLVCRELVIESESNKRELINTINAEKYILLDSSENLSLIGVKEYVEKFLEKMTMSVMRQVDFIHKSDNFKLCTYSEVYVSEIEKRFNHVGCSIKILPMVTGTETVQFCKVNLKRQSSASFILLPQMEFQRKTTETAKDGQVLIMVGNGEYILNLQQFLCNDVDDRTLEKNLNDLLRKEKIHKIGVLVDELHRSRLISFMVHFLKDCSISYPVDIFVPISTDLQQLRSLVDGLFTTDQKQYGGEGHFIELDSGHSEKKLDLNKQITNESMSANTGEAIHSSFRKLPKYKNNKFLIEVERNVKIYLEDAGSKSLTSVVLPVLGVRQLGYPAQMVAECMLRQIDDYFKFNTNTTLCHVKILLKDEDQSTREIFFRENVSRIKRGVMLGDRVHKVGITISSKYIYLEEIERCLQDILNEPVQPHQLPLQPHQLPPQPHQLPPQGSRGEQRKQNGISPLAGIRDDMCIEQNQVKNVEERDEREEREYIDIAQTTTEIEFFHPVRWKLDKKIIRAMKISIDILRKELEAYIGADVNMMENGDFIIEVSKEQRDKAESLMKNLCPDALHDMMYASQTGHLSTAQKDDSGIRNGNGGARPKEFKNAESKHRQIKIDFYTLKALQEYMGQDSFKDKYEISQESEDHYLITVEDGSSVNIKGTRKKLQDVINSFNHKQIELPEDKISNVYDYIDNHKEKVPPYCFVNDDTQTLHVLGVDKKAISNVLNEIKKKVLIDGKSEKSLNTSKPSSSDAAFGASLSISLGRLHVHVKKCDITKLDVDIVVNAANQHLNHGGGVAAAISRAGGRKLEDDCHNYIQKHRKVPVTNICKTSGGEMKCKLVYHAVGPQWYFYDDKTKCVDDLCKTVLRCLLVADNESPVCKSIAFPSISAAIFAVPKDLCSKSYAKAVHYFDSLYKATNLQEIFFVDIDNTMVECITQMFQEFQRKKFTPDKREYENIKNFIHEVLSKMSFAEKDQPKNDISKRKDIVKSVSNQFSVKVKKDDRKKNVEFHLESGISIFVYEGVVTSTNTESFTVVEDIKMNDFANSIRSIIDKAGPEYAAERLKFKKDNQSSIKSGNVITLQAGRLRYRSIFHLILTLQPSQEEIQSAIDNLFKEMKKTETESVTIGIGKLDVSILFGTILSEVTKSTSCLKEIHLVDDSIKTIEKLHECYEKVIAVSGGKIIQDHPTGRLMTDEEHCIICISEISQKKTLSCGHGFCKDCIEEALKTHNKCPICRKIVEGGRKTGNQPLNGTMKDKKCGFSLPGFPRCQTIQIEYFFPSGQQRSEHPNPGRRYEGISRTAYLPDNKEGKEILKLLKIAFKRRLTFTIGTSVTTGRDGVITWNDIHHKTTISGGTSNFGYPDPDYLRRVREELKDHGISAETEV